MKKTEAASSPKKTEAASTSEEIQSVDNLLPCFVLTTTFSLSARLVRIDGHKLYVCQHKNKKLTIKFEIDLREALVSLELPTYTECTKIASPD